MSKSNHDKPFYVDIVGSIVEVRCTSNHDIIVQFDHAESPRVLDYVKKICDRMNKEVEKPIRNCDVGTPEEQMERHYIFCSRNTKCSPDTSICMMCYANWSQTPYKEKEEEK